MNDRPAPFAVVVPMLNEEAGARRCIDEISRALRDSPLSPRLIVVNDGSSDRTGEILAAAENEIDTLTVVSHPRNLGYGQALQTGGRTALALGCDFVIFMDSDLTNDPGFIRTLAEKMNEDCDLVKASLHPGERRRKCSTLALLVSRAAMLCPPALRSSGADSPTDPRYSDLTAQHMHIRSGLSCIWKNCIGRESGGARLRIT